MSYVLIPSLLGIFCSLTHPELKLQAACIFRGDSVDLISVDCIITFKTIEHKTNEELLAPLYGGALALRGYADVQPQL